MKNILLFLQLGLFVVACRNDQDRDGFDFTEECDDQNPTINPRASDLVGDGIDQNCDGIDGTDADGDGHASIASGGDDCDDHWTEVSNKLEYYIDLDADGFGDPERTISACSPPFGYVENSTDCDDSNYFVHPEAMEICDYLDNDCDNLIDDADVAELNENPVFGQIEIFLDQDRDGFGTRDDSYFACFPTLEYAANSDDCDDTDPNIHPDAFDIPGDLTDQDCNGIDGIPDLLYGDIISPDELTIDMFCNSYDSIYGDLHIDMNELDSNSTEALSCLTAIYGDLIIQNINESSVISFENLYQAERIVLEGGSDYRFLKLKQVEDLNISFNNALIFDGDINFPELERIRGLFSWSNGLAAGVSDSVRGDIIGFSSLSEMGGLEVSEDSSLANISGFENITQLRSLSLEDTYLEQLSGFNLSVVNSISLLDNYILHSTVALQNLASTALLKILGNINISDDACQYFTLDTNLTISQVVTPSFTLSNCDIDQDGYTLAQGDCDDQDSQRYPIDSDGDGFSSCAGDCDDTNANINPLAVEIYYDGIDQNCDGANDYDQDGDHDVSVNHGGFDCNDFNPSQIGLDLDQDGLSGCSGTSDEQEIVTSCRQWKEAGATEDGVYALLFPSGDSFQVYCNMTTEGGGWTLFAVTNSSACAEELPFGKEELLDNTTPYFSTLLEDTLFSQFLQEVRADGERTDYTIIWNFLDGSDFMENRFLYAYGYGIGVQWDVNFNGSAYSYVGGWRFSNSAFYSWTQHPWQQQTGGGFSNDDGAWGAADGSVNGNAEIPPTWGQAVSGSSDVSETNSNDCSAVYFDGEAYQSESLRNLLYFR